MKNDEALMHTTQGRFILELIDYLSKSNEDLKSPIIAIEIHIFSKLESCLPVGEPLTANGADKNVVDVP